jgi:hypothetical protein
VQPSQIRGLGDLVVGEVGQSGQGRRTARVPCGVHREFTKSNLGRKNRL